MGFIELDRTPLIQPMPGCRLRTPFGENLMLSYLEMEPGAEVPLHHHVHEQAGVVLAGRLQLTIGDETRTLEPGSMFIVPPNTPHRAIAIDGPVTVMDVFAPIREDYRELSERLAAKQDKA